MNNENSFKIEFERRWVRLAGIMSVLGIALIAGSMLWAGNVIPAGDRGTADLLDGVQQYRSVQMLSAIVQGLGYALLAVPLAMLFKAVSARTDRIRAGLIGLVIAAPLFLGAAAITSAVSNLDAAEKFAGADSQTRVTECVADEATEGVIVPEGETDVPDPKTRDEVETDCRDEVAEDVRDDSGLRGVTAGFAFAGAIGFTIGIVYTALWAMRVGLVSRFWGSLGMAMGAVFLLIPFFVFLWFIYLGFLFAGWVPGGRPPAWAAGEAIPWPDPRRDAAAGTGDDVIEGTAEEVDAEGDLGPDVDPPEVDDSPPGAGDAPQIERRKRKKRNN
ncbi:MAG: hypothetical protein M3Y23_01245 [Actinomycetota bacterium]|nr:hypothetical protein [Actinomycetota bacterium]